MSWILCSERMPDKSGRYLVTYDSQVVPVQYTKVNDIQRFWINKSVYSEQIIDITNYVKAWQPLPEPYKEQEGICTS